MGSASMNIRKGLLLVLQTSVCLGQSTGSKSRFDEILSQFGFGKNPVKLDQQQPENASVHVNRKIPQAVSPELSTKDNELQTKQKFSEALDRFGFGASIKTQSNSQPNRKEVKKHKKTVKKHSLKDKQKFNRALSKFGFSITSISGSAINPPSIYTVWRS